FLREYGHAKQSASFGRAKIAGKSILRRGLSLRQLLVRPRQHPRRAVHARAPPRRRPRPQHRRAGLPRPGGRRSYTAFAGTRTRPPAGSSYAACSTPSVRHRKIATNVRKLWRSTRTSDLSCLRSKLVDGHADIVEDAP